MVLGGGGRAEMTRLVVGLVGAWMLVMSAPAFAQRTGRCIVSDPTTSQLNVRSAPQGRILFDLPNGYPVRILSTSRDH